MLRCRSNPCCIYKINISTAIPHTTLIGGVFYIRRVICRLSDTGDESIEDLLILSDHLLTDLAEPGFGRNIRKGFFDLVDHLFKTVR